MLRSWVEQPLLDRDEINRRFDAVEELLQNRMTGMALSEELDGVYDLERLLSKVSYRSLNARDCLALCASFKRIPEIRNLICDMQSREMSAIREELDPMEDLTSLLGLSVFIQYFGITVPDDSALRDQDRCVRMDCLFRKTVLVLIQPTKSQ